MMHYYDYGQGYSTGYSMMSMFGGLLHLLFWLIVLAIIFRFIKRGKGSVWHRCDHDKSALNILKERYARSEINKEEYEEKKKGLM
jgi:putative membrane protein